MRAERCAKCRKRGTDEKPLYLYLGELWCLPCRNTHYHKRPPMPVSEQNGRPPVEIQYEGTQYTFKTKAEARAVFRRKLNRQRLPSEIAAQLRGE